MASLWTDDDHSAHPWVAARPHPAAPPPPPGAASQPPQARSLAGRASRLRRPALYAAACAAAALAGALTQVVR